MAFLLIFFKILIESFCYTCKDRVQCYANKKIKTYIYLKALLTKENITISDMIECKYYFLLKDSAKEFEIGDLKLESIDICNSKMYYGRQIVFSVPIFR